MSKDNKNDIYVASEERGKGLCASSFFIRFIKRATKFITTPIQVFSLIALAYKKSDNINGFTAVTTKLKTQIFGLFDLVVDFVKGNYKEIETKDVALIVAGIMYLVSPLDLIPDFIPVIGLLDDISILSFIISKLSTEIDAYLLWKNHGIIKLNNAEIEPKVIVIEKTED